VEINSNAVLKTKREIEIHAPIEIVWKVHTDINKWSDWHPDIKHSCIVENPSVGTVFDWTSDGYKLKSQIQMFDENRVIGWIGSGFGASAIHIWEFSSLENGNTLVLTKESMDGWLVKLFKGMMNNKLNKSLENWLNALKKQSELK